MKITYRIVPHKPLFCEFVEFKIQRKSMFFWHTMCIKYDVYDAKHVLDMCIKADAISQSFKKIVKEAN